MKKNVHLLWLFISILLGFILLKPKFGSFIHGNRFAEIIVEIFPFILGIIFLLIDRHRSLKSIGWKPNWPYVAKIIGNGFLVILAFFVILVLTQQMQYQAIINSIVSSISYEVLFLTLFGILYMVALEICYTGYLFGKSYKLYGWWPAVLLSTFVKAISFLIGFYLLYSLSYSMSFDYSGLSYSIGYLLICLICLSIIINFIYLDSKSIWIIALANYLFILFIAVFGKTFFSKLLSPHTQDISDVIYLIMCLTLITTIAFVANKKRKQKKF